MWGSLYTHTHTHTHTLKLDLGTLLKYLKSHIKINSRWIKIYMSKKNENLKVQDENTGALFSNLKVGKALVNMM